MRTTDTASRPNLARLSREDRIDIAVAEARGAAWETDGNRWRLLVGGKYVATVWAEGFFPIGLPNITSDPAAWGALMEEERIGIHPPSCETDTWAASVDLEARGWRRGARPGEAVALAFLAMRGITID